jgi:uncharacterized protein (DUF2267 family)
MTTIDTIDRTVGKTYEWLAQLQERAGIEDRQRAYLALRAVLLALRDRVGPEVAAHISAQLPLLIRGVFYERWDPTVTPMRLSVEEFLERVERDAMLKGASDTEDATRAVFALLWDQLGEGTMGHVVAVLPAEYAVLL